MYVTGEWSCWTDWSVCSVSCGIGYKQRTRDCLAVNNKDAEGSDCEGPSIAQEPCEMPTCQCKHILSYNILYIQLMQH